MEIDFLHLEKETFPFFIISTLFSLNQSPTIIVDNDGGKLIFNSLSICIFALIELYFFILSINSLHWGGKNWIWLPRKILQVQFYGIVIFLLTTKKSCKSKKKKKVHFKKGEFSLKSFRHDSLVSSTFLNWNV